MRCHRTFLFVLTLGLFNFLSRDAAAQSSGEKYVPPTAQPVEDPEDEKDKDDDADESPMGWLSLGVKVGFGHIAASDMKNPTYSSDLAMAAEYLTPEQRAQYGFGGGEACTVIEKRCKLDARAGMRVAVLLAIGGDGMGWDIEPYMWITGQRRAFGAYTGPKLDLHLARPLYLGIGAGLAVARLQADHYDYGVDIMGRIPVRLTWYAGDNFGFILEFAFGAGATGYAAKPTKVTPDPMMPDKQVTTTPSLAFGTGRTWDATFGVRFP
jgi:hypothetical protein